MKRIAVQIISAAFLLSPGGFAAENATVSTNVPARRAAQETRPAGVLQENVSDEQRAKLREVNEKMRGEQAGVNQKLRQARKELEQAVQAETVDEKAIREKAQAVGELEGDAAVLRAKHYAELRKILPKQQADKLSLPRGASNAPTHRPSSPTNNTDKPAAK